MEILIRLTRVLDLPQSTQTDGRPDKKFRQGLIEALLQYREHENKYVPWLALSPRPAGDELLPYWGEDNGVSRGQVGGLA